MDDELRHLSDFHLAQECMDGDCAAIATLRSRCSGLAIAFLTRAGGAPDEAAEIVECLWSDLLATPADGLPRIAHYNGRCAFQTWLNTVALNRLITRKRKQARWDKLIDPTLGRDAVGDDRLPTAAIAEAGREPDRPVLIELMRTAIEHAFTTCDPEDFVLLQLRHCDGILSKELAIVFDCDPGSITRRLEKAQDDIATRTLWKIRQRDPWLELRWTDFTELCQTATPACFGLD